jgi:putative transposase
MVEDLLAARGVIVSHQTVRSWAETFGLRTLFNGAFLKVCRVC